MGHQHAKPERLKTEVKSKFDKRELMMIKNAFHDLCIRWLAHSSSKSNVGIRMGRGCRSWGSVHPVCFVLDLGGGGCDMCVSDFLLLG